MYFNYRFFREVAPSPPAGGGYKTMADIEKEAEEARKGTPPAPSYVPPAPPEGKKWDIEGKNLIDDPDYKKPEDKSDRTKFDEKGRALPPEGKMYATDGVSLVDDPNYKKVDPNAPPAPPAGKKFDVDGKTLIDDPDYKAPEDDEEPDFWLEVEKHTGNAIKVEYPEGIEPASVEGAAIREQAVIQQAIDTWEGNLREKFPRAFAYMVHHMDGGSDQEFLNNERGISLPERTIVETSVDIQTQMYKGDLVSKGVDVDIADAQVAKAVKDNTLKDKALKVYDGVAKAQKDELDNITERNRREAQRVDGVIKQMTSTVEKTIAAMDFIVPEAERGTFQNYFIDNLQYDKRSDTFAIVVPVKAEDLKGQMEAMFLQFKKGDLSKIVKRKVQTKAAQILKVRADKTKTPTPNQQDDKKDQTNFIPLGSMGK